jgi:hypothetical protein
VLVRTSNPGAAEFQDRVSDSQPLDCTVAAPVLEGPLSRWKPLELRMRSRAPSRAPREPPRRQWFPHAHGACPCRGGGRQCWSPVLVASAGRLLPGPLLLVQHAPGGQLVPHAPGGQTKELTERISVLAWKAKCNGWVAIENACVCPCARASHVRSWSTCTDHGDSRRLAPRLYRQTVRQRRISSRYNR